MRASAAPTTMNTECSQCEIAVGADLRAARSDSRMLAARPEVGPYDATRSDQGRTPQGLCAGGSTWRVQQHEVIESTMTHARELPPWHAVVAEAQTAGRGQMQRKFISDRGGIYLTAVLPYGGDAAALRGFALAVGCSVRAELLDLGVKRLRLKWPNDLMIGRGKVGGILIEQGQRDTLLVGVGLNVTNRPWRAAPELAGIAGTLSEACEGGVGVAPSSEQLIAALLNGIATAHVEFAHEGLRGLVARLNTCWDGAREVELTLVGRKPTVRGEFLGIDADGGLRVLVNDGASIVLAANQVERLREV